MLQPRGNKTKRIPNKKRITATRHDSSKGIKHTHTKTKVKSGENKFKIKTKSWSSTFDSKGIRTTTPQIKKSKFKVKNGRLKNDITRVRGGKKKK